MRTKRLTVRISKELTDFIDYMVEIGKAKNRVGVAKMALERAASEREKQNEPLS